MGLIDDTTYAHEVEACAIPETPASTPGYRASPTRSLSRQTQASQSDRLPNQTASLTAPRRFDQCRGCGVFSARLISET
jgi:hypothetical protein